MAEIVTKKECEAIIERSSKTTPGPWVRHTVDKVSRWSQHTVYGREGIVANVDEGKVSELEANADFIANSKQDLERLARAYMEAMDMLEHSTLSWRPNKQCNDCEKVNELLRTYHGEGKTGGK